MVDYHNPVLLAETIKALDVVVGQWYLDCTLGDGGLSLEILRLGGKIVGLDVDPEAIGRARKRLQDLGYNEQSDFVLVRSNFRDIDNLIAQTEAQKFKGVIFDLGVSSLQLNSPQKGFSFEKTGPLDMRMDPDLEVRAIDLLHALSRKELDELFTKFGEEKLAGPIASVVVSSRSLIRTTEDLANLIAGVYRKYNTRGKIHPATRVFQALRIAVNDELGSLQEALEKVLGVTDKNGNIVVISFHSLEDRIIKLNFRKWQESGLGQIVTKKPITPSVEEIMKNPRARSAKMRVFKT